MTDPTCSVEMPTSPGLHLYLRTFSCVAWVDRETTYAVVDLLPEAVRHCLTLITRTHALAEELWHKDLEMTYEEWSPSVYTDTNLDHLSDEEYDQLENGEVVTSDAKPLETLEATGLNHCTLHVDHGGLYWTFSLGEASPEESTAYVSRAVLEGTHG
jgi:hypothetical protein